MVLREAVSETLSPGMCRATPSAFAGHIEHQASRGRSSNASATPVAPARAVRNLLSIAGRCSVRAQGRSNPQGDGRYIRESNLRRGTAHADRFATDVTLPKITLLMPAALLEAVLPQARDLIATPISSQQGRGALFATYLQTLARERRHLTDMSVPGFFGATLDLLAAALKPEELADGPTVSARLLSHIQEYINEHLAEPTSPLSIQGDGSR